MGRYQRRVHGDITTERGLLMLSPLLRLLLPLRLRPIPGMDTTAMDTGLMAMDTTMERGLLMLSLLLTLPLPLRLMLMPGMDTTVMDTGLMPMDTMDTGPMVITGERSKKPRLLSDCCQLMLNILLSLPTLRQLNTIF